MQRGHGGGDCVSHWIHLGGVFRVLRVEFPKIRPTSLLGLSPPTTTEKMDADSRKRRGWIEIVQSARRDKLGLLGDLCDEVLESVMAFVDPTWIATILLREDHPLYEYMTQPGVLERWSSTRSIDALDPLVLSLTMSLRTFHLIPRVVASKTLDDIRALPDDYTLYKGAAAVARAALSSEGGKDFRSFVSISQKVNADLETCIRVLASLGFSSPLCDNFCFLNWATRRRCYAVARMLLVLAATESGQHREKLVLESATDPLLWVRSETCRPRPSAENGLRAISVAIENQDAEMLEILLASKYLVAEPLHLELAVSSAATTVDCLRVLLDYVPLEASGPLHRCHGSSWHPFTRALRCAAAQNPAALAMLLARIPAGLSVDMTPLLESACERNRVESVALLLKHPHTDPFANHCRAIRSALGCNVQIVAEFLRDGRVTEMCLHSLNTTEPESRIMNTRRMITEAAALAREAR